MKKQLLIFLLSIITLSAFGQAGSLSQSVYRSRVNDSTAAIAANVAPIAAGYAPFFWNNQATTPGWRVWNGTSYDIGFSSGGNFWKNAGTTTLTGNATINLSGNDLSFNGGASTGRVILSAENNIPRIFSFRTNNVHRWAFRVDGNETGSEVGGDFAIRRYNDAGTFVDAPISITRSTGLTTIAGPLKVTSGTPGTGKVLTSDADGDATWESPSGGGFVSPTALTDGASISITSTNNTLTTTQSTITFSDGWTGNYSDVSVTFNQTSATWTFPAGALCVVDGVASGSNVCTVTGTSGDKIELSIRDIDGTNYRVAIKNFE